MEDSGRRALRARAVNAVAHTQSLRAREPEWRSEVHPLADGWLILAGRGMYINQAVNVGGGAAVTGADLDVLLARSETLGVTPAIEVTEATRPDNVRRIRECGFVHRPESDITCLIRSTAVASPDEAAADAAEVGAPMEVAVQTTEDLGIRPVESAADLLRWQEVSAAGWGHVAADARRASDAFAAAANALPNEHMVIAVDPADARPLGCASMTVRAGVAMLGGMSTLPDERRRGVQASLVSYRLGHARRLGCDLAVTTAASGSASERNLRRHGFVSVTAIQRFTPYTAA
ncbi:MAG: GNAT family N-acetyltransferase [Actinomycetota bacterium]